MAKKKIEYKEPEMIFNPGTMSYIPVINIVKKKKK